MLSLDQSLFEFKKNGIQWAAHDYWVKCFSKIKSQTLIKVIIFSFPEILSYLYHCLNRYVCTVLEVILSGTDKKIKIKIWWWLCHDTFPLRCLLNAIKHFDNIWNLFKSEAKVE